MLLAESFFFGAPRAAIATATTFCHGDPVSNANTPLLGYTVTALVATPLCDGAMANANSPLHGFLVAALVVAAFRDGAVPNANPPVLGVVGAAFVATALYDGPVPNANSPAPPCLLVAALVAADGS